MSDAVSISEAKTQLSRLIAAAERGEEVTIRRGATPVARIVALSPTPTPHRRVVGALAGQVRVADDADDLGPEWDPYT